MHQALCTMHYALLYAPYTKYFNIFAKKTNSVLETNKFNRE
jgi:hypothetical protein